jgi:hypothetical protein
VGNNPVKYVDPSGHRTQDPYWCVNARNPGQCRIDYYGFAKMQQSASSYTAIDPSKTIVLIICGVNDGNNCGTDQSTLKNYEEWARNSGFQVITLDVDQPECGGHKIPCDALAEEIIANNPDANFILIGHSAGADVAIVAGDYMIQNQKSSQLKGLILLDPTLTDPNHDSVGGLMPMLSRIIESHIPVFVGDTIGKGSDNEVGITSTPSLDPNQNKALWPYFNYAYFSFDQLSHSALATDLAIRDYATWFITFYYLPWPQAQGR